MSTELPNWSLERLARGIQPVSRIPTITAFLIAATLSSCTVIFSPPEPPVPAPANVRSDALIEAIRYIGMEYEWGGQDIMPRGIDCSGLVVNVYYLAAAINGYSLPFADATAAGLHDTYSTPLDSPEPGDLIFMGAAEESTVTHVAIYESTVDGQMTFIDSTYIPESGINGVSRRSYPNGDPRFKAFGRVLLTP